MITLEEAIDCFETMSNEYLLDKNSYANGMALEGYRLGKEYKQLAKWLKELKERRAADVQLVKIQPVPQWISVDDRLPEDTETVLVWYKSNTLFGLSEGYGLSWYSPTAKWYKNELNGENIAVLYWQPLTEPPEAIKG